ncbi:MAG: hypothetical protein K2X61_14645 [Caulobacteraceae bacterium]|nr:hypothetical protein [Caulobacteraceae bacterium]
MNRGLKAFLRAVAALFLWGGPAVGVLVLVGTVVTGVDAARLTVGVFMLAYATVGGLVIGGFMTLLLSIDDRLERLEGNL